MMKKVILLASLFSMLYIPFIMKGGLLRDDLFFLPARTKYGSYLSFQSMVSSSLVMTARPVSAFLQGFSIWFFGSQTWVMHAINLGLFLGSILFIYQALKNLGRADLAWLTALFAIVYPGAASTTFSAIMMNSNLAGFFWSLALYLDTKPVQGKLFWRDTATTSLLILSALSYEAFIPLFLANLIVRIIRIPPGSRNAAKLAGASAPLLIAAAGFGLYRGELEQRIFLNDFSRIETLISVPQAIWVFIRSNAYGLKISFLDTLSISTRAVRNLNLLSPFFLIFLIVVLIGYGLTVYLILSGLKALGRTSTYHSDQENLFARIKMGLYQDHELGMVIIGVILFAACQAIFVFSDYYPSSYGFENRTQGAIRFAASFLLVSVIIYILYHLQNEILKKWMSLLSTALFCFFGISVVGQGQAWIAAARFNDVILARIQNTLTHMEEFHDQKKLTLLAELPNTFPGEVNGEPIYGETWDLSSALRLKNPGKEIEAGIFQAERTRILNDGIVIDGIWEAKYPFLFYRWPETYIEVITNKGILENLLPVVVELN